MKATATANANIALVKYWGNRNKELVLPNNSSISMTTDKLNTKTTVEFSKKFSQDTFFLNKKPISGESFNRVLKHLNLIKKLAHSKEKAKIVSENNFPTAGGLASSASGFAALTLGATTALGLKLNKKELSIIARQGSGSASRSIFGGFVEWKRGKKRNGSDSFAKQIVLPSFWKDFYMIATVVSSKEKAVKSNVGMNQTILTSPLYKAWLKTVGHDFKAVKKGVLEKNFSLVGSIAEQNALKMHATMITTKPSLIYWEAGTMKVIHLVSRLRKEGTECFFTIDAGPQVKVLCQKKNLKKIQKELNAIREVKKIILCTAGEEAKISVQHKF